MKYDATVQEFKNTIMDNRKDDVILTRLRIGHTKITHNHLLEKSELPKCQICKKALTVKHIIVDCIGYANERQNCNISISLRESIANDADNAKKLIEFINRTKLRNEI